MTSIPLTLDQAKAMAVVDAAGRMNAESYWRAAVQIATLGVPATEPTMLQRRILDDVPLADTDQVHLRLARLKYYGHGTLYTLTQRFADLRNVGREGDKLLSVDFLGLYPRDPVGQRVLLYGIATGSPTAMSLAPARFRMRFFDIAKAFSVPFAEFGERVLEGEQLWYADKALASALKKAWP